MNPLINQAGCEQPPAVRNDRNGPPDDPESLAQWWRSLDFLCAETRLRIADQALAHCTHGGCRRLLTEARQALREFVAPRPLAAVLGDALGRLAGAHPVFCALAAAALALLAWRGATLFHRMVLGLLGS